MPLPSDFDLDCAAQSRREAEETGLPKARNIRLQAAEAWQAMGERTKRLAKQRDERAPSLQPESERS